MYVEHNEHKTEVNSHEAIMVIKFRKNGSEMKQTKYLYSYVSCGSRREKTKYGVMIFCKAFLPCSWLKMGLMVDGFQVFFLPSLRVRVNVL